MEFEIVPYVRIGVLAFGLARTEVSGVLGMKMQAVRQGAKADFARAQGVMVYYDDDDKLEAVEFGGKTVPTLEGQALLGPFEPLLAWFLDHDPAAQPDDQGLNSPKYGVGLYVPSPGKPVASVLVYRQGYYEEDTD